MKIEHVIVLMMENRSFDHMLGFLNHPEPTFDGLSGNETNGWDPGSPPIKVSRKGEYASSVDPNHSHEGVMRQLLGLRQHNEPYLVNNSGFVWDYEFKAKKDKKEWGYGPKVMECFDPKLIPVLSTLAKKYAVCDQWYCSVPGATWPNRNFAHAGTSDGMVDITPYRLYYNKTIFEVLADEGRDWSIFFDGFAQVFVFPRLLRKGIRKRIQPIDNLFERIRENKLPHYSFVEPKHFGSGSNSQHPYANKNSGKDLLAGEKLICEIYSELTKNQEVWNKTLFVITYDEHGGFFDHKEPPISGDFEDGNKYTKGNYEFRFNLLGPRVPAVLISPFIPEGTIDSTVYDHSSIIASVAEILNIRNKAEISPRVEKANTFTSNLSLQEPRTDGDEIRATLCGSDFGISEPEREVDESEKNDEIEMDDFWKSLIWIGKQIYPMLKRDIEETVVSSKHSEMSSDVVQASLEMLGNLQSMEIMTLNDIDTFQSDLSLFLARSSEPLTLMRDNQGLSYENPSRRIFKQKLTQLEKTGHGSVWLSDMDGAYFDFLSYGLLEFKIPSQEVYFSRQTDFDWEINSMLFAKFITKDFLEIIEILRSSTPGSRSASSA